MAESIVIVAAKRTPMGSFQSDFANLSASDLGAVAIKAAVEQAGLKPEQVEQVYFGNVLMAGRARKRQDVDWQRCADVGATCAGRQS